MTDNDNNLIRKIAKPNKDAKTFVCRGCNVRHSKEAGMKIGNVWSCESCVTNEAPGGTVQKGIAGTDVGYSGKTTQHQ